MVPSFRRHGATHYRHYVVTPSGITAILHRNSDNTSSLSYALSDHLGSAEAIISGTAGNLLVGESFDAFGQRRQANWSAGSPSTSEYSAIAGTTRRGFTFHEQLDNIALTHMNGRVYDPSVGRFLSMDPIVADVADSQSLNPYAYVGNRPLSHTDPTGLVFEGATVVIEAGGGPENPYADVAAGAVAVLELFLGGGFFGGTAQPPPATSIASTSAQSGTGSDPCASSSCQTVGVWGSRSAGSAALGLAQAPPEFAVGFPYSDGFGNYTVTGTTVPETPRFPVDAEIAAGVNGAINFVFSPWGGPRSFWYSLPCVGGCTPITADDFWGSVDGFAPISGAFTEADAAYDAVKGIGWTGKIGEQALKKLGGRSQVFFRTAKGGRYVDQLVNNIAHESKVGYTSLSSTVRNQIAKDVELLKSKSVSGVVWHFFTSPVTGARGPSAALEAELKQAGIKSVLEP